jgi:hypothetical protein
MVLKELQVGGNWDADRVKLPKSDFRRGRAHLAPHVYAIPGGDPLPAQQLVKRKTWESVMALPTEVLLLTSGNQGKAMKLMYDLYAEWLHASPMPEAEGAKYAETSWDAADALEAAGFIAAHGFYMQAIGCLRNALEPMIHSAALAITADTAALSAWRNGTRALALGGRQGSLTKLRTYTAGIGGQVLADELFGPSPTGWIGTLFGRLSKSTHAEAGHTNIDLWNSNGPVWRSQAYNRVLDDTFEVTAALLLPILLS